MNQSILYRRTGKVVISIMFFIIIIIIKSRVGHHANHEPVAFINLSLQILKQITIIIMVIITIICTIIMSITTTINMIITRAQEQTRSQALGTT